MDEFDDARRPRPEWATLEAALEPREVLLTEDLIAKHAAAKGWPIVRCGEPCGFIATVPDNAAGDSLSELLAKHVCARQVDLDAVPKPTPSLARLVVGCLTLIAVLIIIGVLIEDLAGVK
jgi:hypothetical protein